MGFLKEKYTKTYFLSRNENGEKVNYGAIGGDDFLNGKICDDIRSTLSLIKDYRGRNVLEIGFGRGESIKYIYQHKASSYYGIDFSQAAYDLANEYVMPNIHDKNYQIVCDDALLHIKNNKDVLKQRNIDVIILLDAIEHIPVAEIKELFLLLKEITKEGCLFIAHTPFYRIDEDFAKTGVYINPSYTDLIEETKGMHCNKYTKQRFLKEFKDIGFHPLKKKRLFLRTENYNPILTRILSWRL